jgi:hypothetical protein
MPSTFGGGAATGSPLHISARNIAFDTNHLEAPAGQAFVVDFDNNDPGVPHNIEIKDATGASLFKGQIITGPAKTSYRNAYRELGTIPTTSRRTDRWNANSSHVGACRSCRITSRRS